MDKYAQKARAVRNRRNCEDKKAYSTIAWATVMGKRYNQKIYKCKICNKYHLTSQKKFKDTFEKQN